MYSIYYKNKQGVWQYDTDEFYEAKDAKTRLSYVKKKLAAKGRGTAQIKPI